LDGDCAQSLFSLLHLYDWPIALGKLAMSSKKQFMRKRNIRRKSIFSGADCYVFLAGIVLRSMHGGYMVEGAVGLMLVIIGFIFSALLLMNSGSASYNQEKLGFVANSAATYAATYTGSSRQTDVTNMVTDTMSKIGLDTSNTNVTITDVTLGRNPAVSVAITAKLPVFMGGAFNNIMPQQVQLSDTAIALKPINTMKYLVVDLGGRMTVPLINATGVIPNDPLPAWYIGIAGVRRLR
jgi:hypothetical protein